MHEELQRDVLMDPQVLGSLIQLLGLKTDKKTLESSVGFMKHCKLDTYATKNKSNNLKYLFQTFDRRQTQ